MIFQTTLRKTSDTVVGTQFGQDDHSSVKFHPASPSSGIVFVRSDLPGAPVVECGPVNMRTEARWTSFAQDGVCVHHTEHILAALVGNGVDNVIVEVDSEYIPIVSAGSCMGFSEALLGAGIKSYNVPRKLLKLCKPVYYEAPLMLQGSESDGGQSLPRRCVVGLPSMSFHVCYVFHVPSPSGIRIGMAEYNPELHVFSETIGLARTYFLGTESTKVQTLFGPVAKDFVVVTPTSTQSVVDEVARHKIVDFMGDLAALGHPIAGRFLVFRSGHRFHHDLVCNLISNSCIELTVMH